MTTSTVIPATETGPSLEDEAAAQAAAAEKSKEAPKLAGEENAPQRPENVPEKFWDAEKGVVNTEALLKSYSELEKGGKGDEGEAAETETAAEEAVSEAGLDMDALSAEYADKGTLTDESLAKLAKAGITKDMVDQYIAGQEAQANQVREQLIGPVGGEEAYGDMISWATDNLPDAEIDAYNAALESGDMNTIKMAVENLNTKYTAENGSEPTRQLNGKAGAGTGGVYESTADLMKDMQNPEYDKNPAFRAKVEAKLGRSSIL